ncbi:MarR family transcriptional regulator [Clostridiales bacterium COT073_COT-073]|nr:MarR family transcriptional regulator [Clostridiales bacterium COT073_COT-073]
MNDIELKILIGMHRNVNSIDKSTSRIASEHGLTFSQFAVLEALYSKGDMTVGMVRKHILSSMGTIPLIINNLVKMNYVQRRSDENDRRICIISLTAEGRELIKKLAPQNEKMIKDYMSILTNEEKNNLFYLMKKLGGKINEEKSAK